MKYLIQINERLKDKKRVIMLGETHRLNEYKKKPYSKIFES